LVSADKGFTPALRFQGQLVLDVRPLSIHESPVLLSTLNRSGLQPSFPALPIRFSAFRRELTEVERKLDELIDAIASGYRSASLQQRLDHLETRRVELGALLQAAPPPQPLLHPNLAELYRQRVADLHAALADPVDGTKAVELVRTLIERVEVKPKDDVLEIELVGAIAQMVHLAMRDDTFVREPFASSVKVVAVESKCGAGCLTVLPIRFPPLSSGGASLGGPRLPFPHSAHRTGHADLPASGSRTRLTPSSTARRGQA
jgi:hypothetical protein